MTGGTPAATAHQPGTDADELILSDAIEGAPAPAIGAPDSDAAHRAEHDDDADAPEWGATPGISARHVLGWLLAGVTVIAGIGWIAAMLTLAWPQLGAIDALTLTQFVAALCMPPALIGVLWLLGMRTSRREARRFADVARAMRAEATALEHSIARLAMRIERNRVELAEQTAAFGRIGDRAVDQVDGASAGLGAQVRAIEATTNTLAESLGEAERRVELVLASLPRAHDEMRGLAERVDAAGLLASQHAAALDTQLTALAERGREANDVASGAAERLAAHIARMEATSESASARLEGVTGQMSAAVDSVLDRTTQAVDGARAGIAAQGEAMLAMLSANQAAIDRAGRDSIDALAERIAAVEGAIDRIGARLGDEHLRSATLFDTLNDRLGEADAAMTRFHDGGVERTQSLAAAVSALTSAFEGMGDAMGSGEALARKVIATADDLLLALDAAAREIDETLPEALARLDQRIAASRQAVAGAKPELLALVTAAESTHDAIEAIADVVAQQRETLARTQAALLDTLAASTERAATLSDSVEATIAAVRSFGESAAPQLADALVRVRDTSVAAAEHAREALDDIVPHAERALEAASDAALRRAVDGSVRRQIAALAEATDDAVAAATRASERLAGQLAMLTRATDAIEHQVEQARDAIETADSENFARRNSALVDSLNSAAIDITRAFAADVSDSAWAAYLKGDRGVFTRRAVRLLEPGETREIVRLYDSDPTFRENVNRYIHDFEAMLRQVLALRDGSPLGVTLLSSDVGKLYVALAQAIERLRA